MSRPRTIRTIARGADPLGYDVKWGEDLDPSGRSASGIELVQDAMLHRLSATWLYLTEAPDDKVDFGEDVRLWVGEALTQQSLDAKAPRLEEVIRRDPRIASVTVDLTMQQSGAHFNFLIAAHAITINGQTIDRIIGVNGVTVEFLAEGR